MKEIGESLKLICVGISERYEIQFVEIGYESDHIHFFSSKCSKYLAF